ncbi:hypothetical protein CAI21_18585 [Alkalilimnicola ehrlichii]|uniref:PET hydrolase/cutinase-like domain-containing protein n=1 Tax=Alkalilimnicola ehrlichii TaxID=351052 RepID=A0A3E0WKX3_9GAMM|nr:hypothetical protein [Alkalilimnicola ehrlichii]RFA25772.1 hypothetical protein CAI21_18585 [Alkalilimnicola ehrlichii]RFA32853.1 hypothetical protein CAL65_18840 [Alkalilimnicola ehrlichii]
MRASIWRALWFVALLLLIMGCGGDSDSNGGSPGRDDSDNDPSVGSEFYTAGPFGASSLRDGAHTFYYPRTLGTDGIRHPVVLWGNGTGTSPSSYGPLLRLWASHGFVVAAANTASAGSGEEMLAGLDRLIQLKDDPDSLFYQAVDTARVAASGHSQGGLGALAAGRSERVTTVMPIQGALTFTRGITGSAFFLAGENDTIISASGVRRAYEANTGIPAAYGSLRRAGHMEPSYTGGGYRGPTTAWLRWQLLDDPNAEAWFVGENCVLCASPDWVYEANALLNE